MMHFEDIIVRPHITEKSNLEAAGGKYTFIVNAKAKKTEIKQAVEKLFQVKVIWVNTVNYKGKTKRLGVHEGKRPNWKKAIVQIDINPEAETYLAKGGKLVGLNKKYKESIEEFGAIQ
ncbi:MAG TPA: 50S ribosomal protein L23 [Clostridiales bacterium]|nr:50S ribosomal protein L23 [Clostridiales bacterium]